MIPHFFGPKIVVVYCCRVLFGWGGGVQGGEGVTGEP